MLELCCPPCKTKRRPRSTAALRLMLTLLLLCQHFSCLLSSEMWIYAWFIFTRTNAIKEDISFRLPLYHSVVTASFQPSTQGKFAHIHMGISYLLYSLCFSVSAHRADVLQSTCKLQHTHSFLHASKMSSLCCTVFFRTGRGQDYHVFDKFLFFF